MLTQSIFKICHSKNGEIIPAKIAKLEIVASGKGGSEDPAKGGVRDANREFLGEALEEGDGHAYRSKRVVPPMDVVVSVQHVVDIGSARPSGLGFRDRSLCFLI